MTFSPLNTTRLLLTLLTLTLLLTACGGPRVQYSPLNNPVGPTGEFIADTLAEQGPVSPASVRIFVTQKPEQPYRELGVLSYTTSAFLPDEETSFRLFRERAAELGADGVIILQSREEGSDLPAYGYRWWNNTTSTRTTFRGMAIQFINIPE